MAWSLTASAIPLETLKEALSASEVSDKLSGVDIQRIEQTYAAKCPGCYGISVQGTKSGFTDLPVNYEMTFSTDFDLFSNQLKVKIESETKN